MLVSNLPCTLHCNMQNPFLTEILQWAQRNGVSRCNLVVLEEGLCPANSGHGVSKWPPASLTFGLPSSSSFGEPATRLLLPAAPFPYLQLGGVGRDVPGNLEHLALLTDEDPAQAAAGGVLASQAACQEQQQAREVCRHLCLHICARRLYRKGKNAETSQASSRDARSAPKAGTNHVAPRGWLLSKFHFMTPDSLWSWSGDRDEQCWFFMTQVFLYFKWCWNEGAQLY